MDHSSVLFSLQSYGLNLDTLQETSAAAIFFTLQASSKFFPALGLFFVRHVIPMFCKDLHHSPKETSLGVTIWLVELLLSAVPKPPIPHLDLLLQDFSIRP